MSLYIVRHGMFGTAVVVDAPDARTAARYAALPADASDVRTTDDGAVAVHLNGAPRPIVTAAPIVSAVAYVSGAYVVVPVVRADGAITGHYGLTRDGRVTDVYSGDYRAVAHGIRAAVARGEVHAPIDDDDDDETRELPPSPRIPTGHYSAAYPTGASAVSNGSQHALTVAVPGGEHSSTVRAAARAFARSVWGESANVTDRLGMTTGTDNNGRTVPLRMYAVAVADEGDAYAHGTTCGLYPLPDYTSDGARVLRSVTATRPHVWCERYGWHDATAGH